MEINYSYRNLCAILGGLASFAYLAELVNIGTLFAFVIVCAAVLIMRRTHPDAHRPFRAPWVSTSSNPRGINMPYADVLFTGGKLAAFVYLVISWFADIYFLRKKTQHHLPVKS